MYEFYITYVPALNRARNAMLSITLASARNVSLLNTTINQRLTPRQDFLDDQNTRFMQLSLYDYHTDVSGDAPLSADPTKMIMVVKGDVLKFVFRAHKADGLVHILSAGSSCLMHVDRLIRRPHAVFFT
jgi:hypothetical protein